MVLTILGVKKTQRWIRQLHVVVCLYKPFIVLPLAPISNEFKISRTVFMKGDYIYIYIYIYTHTHTHIHERDKRCTLL
jgi:hypothetical protein